ncbi:MAG: hypothetical protein R3D80_05315 [Paracoccaceae bacterium]
MAKSAWPERSLRRLSIEPPVVSLRQRMPWRQRSALTSPQSSPPTM